MISPMAHSQRMKKKKTTLLRTGCGGALFA
jgi:hypothetical protein